jgi:nanoRNase/pAp phosphatase (c-di-AMP/oligoRNAs hydrolase)
VQDNDLWRKNLPHAQDIAVYTNTIPFTFADFESAYQQFENEESFAKIVETGTKYREYADHICSQLVNDAEEVLFGEHAVLAVNAPRLFRSQVGHLLAAKKGPFAVVWTYDNGRWHFSLRGNNTIDLSEIAKKYGGGGHKNAAGFFLNFDQPFPFKKI